MNGRLFAALAATVAALMIAPAGLAERTADLMFPPVSFHATDPVGWVGERLGEQLWSKQREIACSVVDNRLTAVQSCHGAGKSYLASRLAAWWLDTHPVGQAFVISTAPSSAQVNTVLWRYIKQAHRAGGLPGVITDAPYPQWKIDGNLVAYGRKPDKEGSFQGLHDGYVLFIIDEAGVTDLPGWLFTAAFANTTGPDDRILAIGNPDDPSGIFAEACALESDWNTIAISVYDTPRFTGEPIGDKVRLVDQVWVDQQIRQPGWKPGSLYHTSRILGLFPETSVETLFPPALLKRAVAQDLPGTDTGGYGLDVARYGDDQTVLYRNRGGVIRLAHTADMQDTEETADMVAVFMRRMHRFNATVIPVTVDAVGVGAGVYDKLHHRGLPAREFNGGARAHDSDRFANRRAEIFWQLREGIEDGRVDLDGDDTPLLKQLGQIRWKTSGGRIHLEPKEEMVKRTGKSPDHADAAAMAYATVMGIGLPTDFGAPVVHQTDSGPVTGSLSADLLERAM